MKLNHHKRRILLLWFIRRGYNKWGLTTEEPQSYGNTKQTVACITTFLQWWMSIDRCPCKLRWLLVSTCKCSKNHLDISKRRTDLAGLGYSGPDLSRLICSSAPLLFTLSDGKATWHNTIRYPLNDIDWYPLTSNDHFGSDGNSTVPRALKPQTPMTDSPIHLNADKVRNLRFPSSWVEQSQRF